MLVGKYHRRRSRSASRGFQSSCTSSKAYITTQHPQPPFFGSGSSCSMRWKGCTCADCGSVCIGGCGVMGVRGLGMGLPGGLSEILGMVEYDPCRRVGLLAVASGFKGHSLDVSCDRSSSSAGAGSASGGLKYTLSLIGRNSLSYASPNLPSFSHCSCCRRRATVGNNC